MAEQDHRTDILPKAQKISGREAALKAPEKSVREHDQEYDRRGVLLPQRSRVGGIITPQ